jgi:arylsulfatase A-like enzyme
LTAAPDPTTRRGFLGAGAAAAFTLGSAGSAAAADRPNVLVLVVDTLRADHVYGDRARTPNMEALMRQGLRFTRFHPEAMPTVPFRNSLLSGRRTWPWRGWHDWPGLLDAPGWEPIESVQASLLPVLRRAGYWTGYVTDNPFLGFAPPYRGLRSRMDRFTARGGQLGGSGRGVPDKQLYHWLHPALRADAKIRTRVRKFLASADEYWRDESRSFAARVYTSGVEALNVAATQRPFALVVDTFEPHEPWTPPRKYINLYGDPDYRGREPGMPRYGKIGYYVEGREQRRLLERMRALYAAEVTMTDHWMGVLLDRLQALRLDRETIVVLTSDHGFFLGEHGWTGKISVALHPALIRTPLVIVDPARRRAGDATDYPAQSHDVAPTLLSMAGVRAPSAMDGIDLSRMFRGRRPRNRLAYGGYANTLFAYDGRWKLIAGNRGDDLRLYDTKRDPGEGRDVSHLHRGRTAAMFDAVVRRAGGRAPYYVTERSRR